MILTRHVRGQSAEVDSRHEVVTTRTYADGVALLAKVKANGWQVTKAAYVWGFNGSTTYTIYKPNTQNDSSTKI